MKINNAHLIISAVNKGQYPQHDLPEMLLLGRSNVGKSSFINTIINRKSLARTSSQPGKTRTINFYNVEDTFCLVDMPGYGYAKVSKSERIDFRRMIQEYVSIRDNLLMVIQLIDFRHPPTANDIEIHRWLRNNDIYPLIVATKVDKVKNSQVHKNRKVIAEKLDLDDVEDVILFSSVTKKGRDEVLSLFKKLIDQY